MPSDRKSLPPHKTRDSTGSSVFFTIVNDHLKDSYLKFEGIVTNERDDRFAVLPSAHIPLDHQKLMSAWSGLGRSMR
jgi:hypothetical protein